MKAKVITCYNPRITLLLVFDNCISAGTLDRAWRCAGEDTLEFHFTPSKIKQQTNMCASSSKVVNHLSQLVVGELVAKSLYFNYNLIFNKQIEIEECNLFTFILNWHGVLTL